MCPVEYPNKISGFNENYRSVKIQVRALLVESSVVIFCVIFLMRYAVTINH